MVQEAKISIPEGETIQGAGIASNVIPATISYHDSIVDILVNHQLDFIESNPTLGSIKVTALYTHSNQEKLGEFVSNVLEKYEFVGVRYPVLQTLLFGDDVEIHTLMQQYPDGIVIATGVKPANKHLDVLYDGICTFEDGTPWNPSFPGNTGSKSVQLKISELSTAQRKALGFAIGIENAEILLDRCLNFDTLFRLLWNRGIRFGIHQEAITKVFETAPRGAMRDTICTVASPRIPIEPTDDTKDTSKAIISQVVKTTGGKADDNRVSTYTFPVAQRGDIVFTITKGKPGIHGIRLDGKPITLVKEGKVYIPYPRTGVSGEPIMSLGWEYIDISEGKSSSGEEMIIASATEPIFITLDKRKKICLAKEIIHNDMIGAKSQKNPTATGTSVIVTHAGSEFQQSGPIQHDYFLQADRITVSGENMIEGGVRGNTSVTIEKGAILSQAEISCEQGNISVAKECHIHSNTIMRALNGTVEIYGNVEHTTILADRIIIHGTAKNCHLIGRDISLENAGGSRIIGEQIQIKNELPETENTYIILEYYTAYARKEQLQSAIQVTTEELVGIGTQEELNSELDKIKTAYNQTRDPKEKESLAQEWGTVNTKIQKIIDLTKKKGRHEVDLQHISNSLMPHEQQRNKGVFTMRARSQSRVFVLPANFALDRDLFKSLNPDTIPEVRLSQMRLFLEETLRRTRDISQLHELGPVLITKSGILSQSDTIRGLEDFYKTHNKNPDLRETIRITLKPKEVPATIGGIGDCFLMDISIRGGGFLVPRKNFAHIPNNSIFPVSFSIEIEGKTVAITSNIKIKNLKELRNSPNYLVIGGEFTDKLHEQVLAKYIIHRQM